MKKSPIRISTYSAGERLQILELCMLRLIDQRHMPRKHVANELNGRLKECRATDLGFWGQHGTLSSFPFMQIIYNLEEAGLIESDIDTDRRLELTRKGRTYLRQCSRRVRIAAVKISCDVLDQIAEVTR